MININQCHVLYEKVSTILTIVVVVVSFENNLSISVFKAEVKTKHYLKFVFVSFFFLQEFNEKIATKHKIMKFISRVTL